ncbi:MAG: ATP-binding protein [Sulfuricaulis sp.]|nr:ATP-binding protein [Sulfuricaulis sp.]
MTTREPAELQTRLQALGFHGLLRAWDDIHSEPWLAKVVDIEQADKRRRGLERRLKNAQIGSFKPLTDFDWQWPKKLDRQAVEDLTSLRFVVEGTNVILLGPNGVGKTMILKNLAHQAAVQGHSVRFVTASDMLAELAAQETSTGLARRIKKYVAPSLVCIDEVGYLSYGSRYADLLFEVVTRRYEANKALLISTNKPFSEWSEVFPNAACVVTLVDRLVHRADVIDIQAESYRRKEAQERAARRSQLRKTTKKTPPARQR